MAAKTVEEALEQAKDMDFFKFMTMMMALHDRIEQMGVEFKEADRLLSEKFAETDRLVKETAESQKETDRQLSERFAETDRQQKETDRQLKETSRLVSAISKDVGGITKSLGSFVEQMVSANIVKMFRSEGYTFTKTSSPIFYDDADVKIAQVDCFLENGEYVLAVEVKEHLGQDDVDDHLEQLDTIRAYMNQRGDRRILIGGVAGAIVFESVRNYAHKRGLFVITQSGEAVTIAEKPKRFYAHEWKPLIVER